MSLGLTPAYDSELVNILNMNHDVKLFFIKQ